MDAGKDIVGHGALAAVAAVRRADAPDVTGLLRPRDELKATNDMPSALARDGATATTVSPTVARLGPGAQLLLRLLGSPAPPATLKAAQALLPEPPLQNIDAVSTSMGVKESGSTAGAVIASALQSGIEYSGLFYESHLADWVGGHRSLEAIRTEPQAASPAHMQPMTALASDDMDPAGAQASARNATESMPDMTTGRESRVAITDIVNAQLDMIDKGELHWQGELWPGLPIEIRLQRDDHDGAAQDKHGSDTSEEEEAGGQRWQARLVTTLPTLGKISTYLVLRSDHLELNLSCAQDATASLLLTAGPRLASTLHATGLQLQHFASQADTAQPTDADPTTD